MESKLRIYFSHKLKQKIMTYQQKIRDPTLTLDTVFKSYNELPSQLRDANSEKIEFIEKITSETNHKGRLKFL
jgi:uncharacterized protein YoxC